MMLKEVLDELFDSSLKAKLLRFLFRNSDNYFQIPELAKKIGEKTTILRRQILNLNKIGLVISRNVRKKKIFYKRIKIGRRKFRKVKRSGFSVKAFYILNKKFEFYNELKNLVLKSSPTSKEKLLLEIRRLGQVKFALLSGIFTNQDNSRVDLLVVGDSISNSKLNTLLRRLERESGREIIFVVMPVDEFNYRRSMFDRFLRSVFEEPHEILFSKIKL